MLFLLYILCGLAAIIVSILAWRLRNDNLFLAGTILTGIVIMVDLFNAEYLWALIEGQQFLELLIVASLFVLPSIFLYKSRNIQDASETNFDGSSADGPVTDEYLDEIINAPDDDIDFDSEYK